jgi:hypothetical protein
MKRLIVASILLLSAAAIGAADLKDFSIYGSVRMGTWMDRTEKFLNDTINSPWDPPPHNIGADPHPDYHFNILPYGNLGIQYKGNNIGATFEMGVQSALNDAYISNVTGQQVFRVEKYYATIRRFFAEWYINNHFTFIIGQDYVPICFFSSNQMYYDNNSFGNTGSLYGGRKPMLEIIFSNFKDALNIGLEAKLATIKVDTCSVQYYEDRYPLTNSLFPKIEASFKGRLNNDPLKLDLKIAGGFQQYELVQEIGDISSGSYDSIKHQPVNCYIAGVHGGITTGPVSLMGDFAMGQNWGPYGLYIGNPFTYRGLELSYLADIFYPTFSSDTLAPGGLSNNNSITKEADVILKFKALPSLSFETGFGWVDASHADSTVAAYWHDSYAFYLQSEIKAMGVVTFTPEIGMYYYGPAKGYGRMMYAGFGTRIDF